MATDIHSQDIKDAEILRSITLLANDDSELTIDQLDALISVVEGKSDFKTFEAAADLTGAERLN